MEDAVAVGAVAPLGSAHDPFAGKTRLLQGTLFSKILHIGVRFNSGPTAPSANSPTRQPTRPR